MTFPTIRYREAFDSDPLDSTPSFTDLSTDVEGFTFDYGKQSALDDFQPGTSSVTLKNDDRRYDPLHAAGPYFGKLKPRKRGVLDVTYNAVTYDQFTTFANGWPQRYAPPAMSYVELAGTDLFILLGNIGLPDTVALLEFAADPCYAWWRLNEEVGTTAADKSGNGRTAVLPYARSDNVDQVATPAFAPGDPLVTYDSSKTMALNGGLSSSAADPPVLLLTDLPTALPVTFETMLIHNVSVDTHSDLLLRAEFAGNGIFCDLLGTGGAGNTDFIIEAVARVGGTGRRAYTAAINLTDQPHHLVVTFEAADCTIYLDGVDVTDTTEPSASAPDPASYIALGGGKPGFNAYAWWDGRLGDARLYTTVLSPTRIAAHADAALTPWTGDTTGERAQRIADYIGLEAGDLDLDTGIVILGPTSLGGDALTELQKLALTEDGSIHVEHRNGAKLTLYDRFVRYTATRSTTSQATFTDDPAAGAPAYRFEPDNLVLTDDESQIVNEAIVQWDQGEARVSDAASILAHGLKSRTYATRLKSAEEAQGRAEWIVANYKDAHVRIQSLTLNPAADSRLWPVALGLRYLDRITFRFKPQDVGTAIQNDYWIQGVHVEASEGVNHWLTTYYVTPASAVGADIEVFILDSSLLDGDAILV